MKTDIFQSLWLGKRLSVMEQLSIRSFLDQGYSFHLYTYQDVENIPQGTTIRRGDEILPADEIFCYQSGYGKGVIPPFPIASATSCSWIAAAGGRTSTAYA